MIIANLLARIFARNLLNFFQLKHILSRFGFRGKIALHYLLNSNILISIQFQGNYPKNNTSVWACNKHIFDDEMFVNLKEDLWSGTHRKFEPWNILSETAPGSPGPVIDSKFQPQLSTEQLASLTCFLESWRKHCHEVITAWRQYSFVCLEWSTSYP